MDGAFCHLEGADDFLPNFAVEPARDEKSPPLRHICEEAGLSEIVPSLDCRDQG